MHRLLLLLLPALIGACATPGYEYEARMAPNIPDATNYRDVTVGRFAGPAGNLAEAEFIAMLEDTVLDGQYWFTLPPPDAATGVYDGHVEIDTWERDVRFERDKQCVEWDGLFDCERRAIVEQECTEETVEVSVTLHLTDTRNGRHVFTHQQQGSAGDEVCVDIAEYPDDGAERGVWHDPVYSSFDPYDAPIGMVEDATIEAVHRFRQDIAPYYATLRAEIMTEAITPEAQNDPRFTAAVAATKRGEVIGACAQWDQLAEEWSHAPAVLHNLGACAEARGDMATAQARYARAAEIARKIPLLKDKAARPIFSALERVSNRRLDDTLIDDNLYPGPADATPDS